MAGRNENEPRSSSEDMDTDSDENGEEQNPFEMEGINSNGRHYGNPRAFRGVHAEWAPGGCGAAMGVPVADGADFARHNLDRIPYSPIRDEVERLCRRGRTKSEHDLHQAACRYLQQCHSEFSDSDIRYAKRRMQRVYNRLGRDRDEDHPVRHINALDLPPMPARAHDVWILEEEIEPDLDEDDVEMAVDLEPLVDPILPPAPVSASASASAVAPAVASGSVLLPVSSPAEASVPAPVSESLPSRIPTPPPLPPQSPIPPLPSASSSASSSRWSSRSRSRRGRSTSLSDYPDVTKESVRQLADSISKLSKNLYSIKDEQTSRSRSRSRLEDRVPASSVLEATSSIPSTSRAGNGGTSTTATTPEEMQFEPPPHGPSESAEVDMEAQATGEADPSDGTSSIFHGVRKRQPSKEEDKDKRSRMREP